MSPGGKREGGNSSRLSLGSVCISGWSGGGWGNEGLSLVGRGWVRGGCGPPREEARGGARVLGGGRGGEHKPPQHHTAREQARGLGRSNARQCGVVEWKVEGM